MYWLLFEDEVHVGVWGLGSAFSRPKAVSRYMADHTLSFNEVGNNIVYALHGHKDRNAGTKFLKLIRSDAVIWWNERYKDHLKALQTFILPPRTGALYKADNWSHIGDTSGKTMSMRTLYGEERDQHPEAEIRTFQSGEVKYLLRTFREADAKLIFMRLL